MKPVKHVGLVMPTHISVSSTTPAHIVEGALNYAQQKGNIQLHHIKFSYDNLDVSLPLKQLTGLNGIVTFISPVVPAWTEQLMRLKCPVVNTGSDPLPSRIAKVHADISPAIPRIVAHFSEMGLNNVGVIGQADVPAARTRMDRFITCAKDARMSVFPFETRRVPITDDRTRIVTDVKGAEKSLIDYLLNAPKPIGLLTFYDILGVHVVEIAQQLGFRVPHDIAVVSAVDTVYCRTSRPELSAMHAPFEKVGFKALALLDQMIEGALPPAQPVTIPVHEMLIRGSSRVPIECIDIERTRQFIHKNAHRGLTVNDVLDLVSVSRPTFEKRFKQRFGCFPGQQIRRARTEYLKQLLETTDLTVTAIAAKAGFSDVNKLNIFFKRETGIPPGKYRTFQRNKR